MGFWAILRRSLFVISWTLLATTTEAQVPAPPLSGQIVDPSGAAIAGACITAYSQDRIVASTSTDEDGQFRLALAPGTYDLTITSEGFLLTRKSVEFRGSEARPVVISLQLEARSESVTVTEQAGYAVSTTSSATRTPTPLINVPQSISVVTGELVRDQMMMSIGDVVRYVPGITAVQGENNRDQVVIRGNSSSADFFVNGLRDDVQYFRDLYNLERVEALKGSNAMMFGRGGGGGVVNRVTKQAGATPVRELTVQGGSFGSKRATADFNQPLSERAAFRLNALYEQSNSFRNFMGLERYGINPTLQLAVTRRTKAVLGYENFHDKRTADRGISSYLGRPVDVPIETFFGDPNRSRVRAGVNLGSASIEHQIGRLNLINRTLIGDYDRFYQNYVPGAVNATQTLVPLSSYNNATQRRNLFNQSDVTYTTYTGPVRHTLLTGAEFGRQRTQNFRSTGYFNNVATSVSAPLAYPVIDTPITYRQSATDADNRVQTDVAATYVQDQIELSRYVQVIAGVRFDRFDLKFHNNRANEQLGRIDNLISPRAGVILKPRANMSVYSNYSVSWLPSSGDQFSSLTTVTQQVKPEKFTNSEIGVKWDLTRNLALTTAVYRLNRTNTRATDPNDPTRIIQTGSQRTNGYEVGINGSLTRKWTTAGGYAYQDAFISSATAAARLGAQVGQVPHHSFSLWNQYQIAPRLSAGVGILNRSEMFAAVDNTVTLPGYARADMAVFYYLTEKLRLQANVENLTGRQYYLNADSNTNITPGSPRAIRIGLIARF